MARNKPPRKRYRPKPIIQDPVAYVIESITPVAKHSAHGENYVLDLKVRNSTAMAALLQGKANKQDMDDLVKMANVVWALLHFRKERSFATEYKPEAMNGRIAILNIASRAVKVGRFVPTGPEVKALNELMELHDAIFEVATVGDVQEALYYARRCLAGPQTIKLPTSRAFLDEVREAA